MYTIRTITLFILASINLIYAQVHLTVDNPCPRIGDDLVINFDLEENNKKMGGGRINLEHSLLKEGPIVVGPMYVTIQSKVYITDSIVVNVGESLPKTVKDGIWIRQVEFDGKIYLIMEQRISGEWKSEKKSKNETSWTFEGDEEYAEMNEQDLLKKGIKIDMRSSSQKSQNLDSENLFGGTVGYKRTVYEFSKTEDFKNKVKLDANYILHFPKHGEYSAVWVE